MANKSTKTNKPVTTQNVKPAAGGFKSTATAGKTGTGASNTAWNKPASANVKGQFGSSYNDQDN